MPSSSLTGAHEEQRRGEADAHAETVNGGGRNGVLAGERLGSAEDDTVDDYQRQVNAELSVDLRDERLDEHLDYCNERSDYNYISGDSDLLGNHLFERRNGDVRAHKDYRSCNAHAQRTLDRGRNRERRAGAEHQTENGVLNENALGKLLKKTLFLCHFLLRPL